MKSILIRFKFVVSTLLVGAMLLATPSVIFAQHRGGAGSHFSGGGGARGFSGGGRGYGGGRAGGAYYGGRGYGYGGDYGYGYGYGRGYGYGYGVGVYGGGAYCSPYGSYDRFGRWIPPCGGGYGYGY